MLHTPTLLVGDVHLGIASPEAEARLLQFLRRVPHMARSLVIMGDLFEFWFAWRHVMPKTGYRVLAAIADLREAGVEVLWIGGNHDCWGGETLEQLTGATYTLEPWAGTIGPWRVHLAHGDGLRPLEDARYRALRRVLRHPLAIRLYGLLHPNTATRVALASSHTSRHHRAGDEGRGLHAIATSWMQRPEDAEFVVFGHAHIPALERAGLGHYGNAGAWYLDQHFLRVTDDAIALCQWDGTNGTERARVTRSG